MSTPTSFTKSVSGILAAKRETIVDLLMLDGSMVTGLTLTKGIIYPIEFMQVLSSSQTFQKAELWALFLPSQIRAGGYV
jgi:hypothetical protein